MLRRTASRWDYAWNTEIGGNPSIQCIHRQKSALSIYYETLLVYSQQNTESLNTVRWNGDTKGQPLGNGARRDTADSQPMPHFIGTRWAIKRRGDFLIISLYETSYRFNFPQIPCVG